jgi:hypothetical protein
MNDAPADGAPVTMSLFQTDTVALKVRMPANWIMRAPGGVAWISGATW